MSSSPLSRYGLFVLSAAVLGAAGWLWSTRRGMNEDASALVQRTFEADNSLEYSAVSSVTAIYGGHQMESKAFVIRAPHKMLIRYTSGKQAGLESGYNDRWFWRRDRAGAPMVAYAEVKQQPEEMAARRFKLLMKNYRSTLLHEELLNGRNTHVVELRPVHPVDNATGPAKKMWIDGQSGLTLRSDSFNYQNQLVMRSVLSDLNTNPQITKTTFAPPDAMLKAADVQGWIAQEVGADAPEVQEQTGLEPPKVAWVPVGFELDGYGVHTCPPARPLPLLAALTRYTDGLNTLTVFAMRISRSGSEAAKEEKGWKTNSGKESSSNVEDNACDFGTGTMVTREKGNVRLLAVADLPRVTLDRVLAATEVKIVGEPQARKLHSGR